MRKSERLDQILVRLGYVTRDQVDEAVRRQQEEGGRFGQNLVQLGALTEEQLFDGLVEQFRLPTVTVDETSLDRELLDRVPAHVLAEGLIVPIAWNEKVGVLSVAAANPSDDKGLAAVGKAFGARKVRVSLAPETVLADLLSRVGRVPAGDEDARTERGGVRLVALPELFEPPSPEPDAPAPVEGGEQQERRVVMVTPGAVRKNFLPAVLGPEGVGLVVVNDAEQLRLAVRGGVDGLLVAEAVESQVRGWIESGAVPDPGCELTVFSSVSSALLDNPASYPALATSLRQSVLALAEYRSLREGVAPPYLRMVSDLDALSDRLALGRLARDGLALAACLLVPAEKGTSIDPFRSFGESVDLARRLRFAWPLDRLLGACLALYLGREAPGRGSAADEIPLAAQLLALVWFRHNLVEVGSGDAFPGVESAEAVDVRGQLRALAGRFASLDVVEAYLGVLERRDETDGAGRTRRALLLAAPDTNPALAPALTRAGCEVVGVASGADVLPLLKDGDVDAVVIDHAAVGDGLEHLCTALGVDGTALAFVLTAQSDPSLVLNLLDLGVRDVFAPPHEVDLIGVRVVRAIRERASAASGSTSEGQFSARLQAFSFLDLSQMLANGMKSARVDLRRGDEEAVLYLANGRPTHAACGELLGPAAVYRVIGWEDDGEFTVDDVDSYPEANIEESMESLLMEGVRLLDESRA